MFVERERSMATADHNPEERRVSWDQFKFVDPDTLDDLEFLDYVGFKMNMRAGVNLQYAVDAAAMPLYLSVHPPPPYRIDSQTGGHGAGTANRSKPLTSPDSLTVLRNTYSNDG